MAKLVAAIEQFSGDNFGAANERLACYFTKQQFQDKSRDRKNSGPMEGFAECAGEFGI